MFSVNLHEFKPIQAMDCINLNMIIHKYELLPCLIGAVKSDKLMKLTVDFGDHTRSILAGIKQERKDPCEIEGKQALFVVNLPERKMAGELSQGMLFDIGYEDKLTPCLAMPEIEIPNGSRAG